PRVPDLRGPAHAAGDRRARIDDAVGRAIVTVDRVAVVAGLPGVDAAASAHLRTTNGATAVSARAVAVVAVLAEAGHAVAARQQRHQVPECRLGLRLDRGGVTSG